MSAIIDSHRHYTVGVSSVTEMIQEMDRDGIEQTVLFGYHGLKFDTDYTQDMVIANLHATYPDRIIPFLTDIDSTKPDFLHYIKTSLESGIFKGIGELLYAHEIFHQRYFSDVALDDLNICELCTLAGDAGVPVLFHVDTPYRQQFERLLQACPDTNIICAHALYQFLEIFGGVEAKVDELAYLLDSYPHLYFDISHWKISPIYLHQSSFRTLLEQYSTRFLFGTDMTDSYTIQGDWVHSYKTLLQSLSVTAAANIEKFTIKGLIETYD